jgi:hypothetical protein
VETLGLNLGKGQNSDFLDPQTSQTMISHAFQTQEFDRFWTTSRKTPKIQDPPKNSPKNSSTVKLIKINSQKNTPKVHSTEKIYTSIPQKATQKSVPP